MLYIYNLQNVVVDGCWEFGDAASYEGDVSYTAAGDPCLNWEYLTYSSRAIDIENRDVFEIESFPDDTWAELGNKCR